MDDSLNALLDAKWFSTLNLQSGYWQVSVHPRHQVKTAFSTSGRHLYEFTVLHFSFCNAPATFICLMDAVLSGLMWETCLVYLDNINVFGRTWEEHLLRLQEVLQCIWDANLKLKPSKCTLA